MPNRRLRVELKEKNANFPCVGGYALCFEKNMALENVFENLIFFLNTNPLNLRMPLQSN